MALSTGRMRLQPLLRQGVKLAASLPTSGRVAAVSDGESFLAALPAPERPGAASWTWGRSLGTAAALADGEA